MAEHWGLGFWGWGYGVVSVLICSRYQVPLLPLRAGGMEGAVVWKMILKAIKELLDKTPPGDQSAVH